MSGVRRKRCIIKMAEEEIILTLMTILSQCGRTNMNERIRIAILIMM